MEAVGKFPTPLDNNAIMHSIAHQYSNKKWWFHYPTALETAFYHNFTRP